MIEREMEDLIAAHAEEFFPRHVLVLKGRQGTFAGAGRFDLLFEDEFQNKILMELKAVAAKLEAAEQLVRYKQALEEKGERNVIMWLVAPVVAKSIADFLDRFGVEYTEIHEAQFRQVASRHDYRFASEAPAPKDQAGTPVPSKDQDEITIARKRLSDAGHKSDVDAYSDPTPIATAEQFKAALSRVQISESELAMLRTQYGAPNHTISPGQMAKELHYGSYAAVNSRYGALAHRVAEALDYLPGLADGKRHWWRTLSYWNDDAPEAGEGQDQWIMRPELAQALQELKWV